MISRRDLFRGTSLGAGALFLEPFMRQLEAAATGSPKPMRVVFFVQGNGVYPDQIQPEGIDRPRVCEKLEDRPLTGHKFARSVDPLEPFARRVTFLNGLSGKVHRGGHGGGFAALGCWPVDKMAYGETVDAAIAKKFGGLFPHVGLGVQNDAAAVIYNLTSWERGKPMPTQTNPIMAHHQLFSVAAKGDARKKFNAKTNLLDFMAEDVKRVQDRLSGAERERLGRYLEAFESMSDRQSELVKLADRIEKAAPTIDPKLADIRNIKGEPTGIFDRLEAQFDIAAASLIAGLTSVVTISSGVRHGGVGVSCNGEEIGLAKGHIDSHGIGHGGSMLGETATELHIRIRRRHMEKLAKFVKKLESIPEGDGSMMDNTLIVYLSDAADQHHPSAGEWPIILVGDLGGRLKLGNRYLRFPWYGKPGHRTVSNFYTSILHVIGDRRERFGFADVKIADLNQDGPLSEIMV